MQKTLIEQNNIIKKQAGAGLKRMLRVFKNYKLERKARLKRSLIKINKAWEMLIQFKQNFKFKLRVKGLRLVRSAKKLLRYLMILIILNLLLLSNVAFAAGSFEISSEAKLGGALAAAGVVTATSLVIGMRYLVLGNNVSGITDKVLSSFDGIFKKYIGESKPSEIPETSSSAPVHEITPGQIELTADRILDKLGKTMDERVDRLNPITYAQNTSEKMASFIKKVLSNTRTDRTNEWVASLEHKIDGLEEGNKIRLQTAVQKLMKDLDKKGGNLDEAFKDIDAEQLECMADYVCVSASRSSGAGEMASIMEPLCLQYSNLILFALIVMLKLAPFYLYYYICIKQKIRN